MPSIALSIQENVSLQGFNTLSVPALARWFVEVDNEEQLLQALNFYQQQQCPLLVLGGGSNVVLTKDFTGIVIKNNIQGRAIERETEAKVFLRQVKIGIKRLCIVLRIVIMVLKT